MVYKSEHVKTPKEQMRYNGEYESEVAMRRCLGPLCNGKEFLSAWKGNRLCDKCNKYVMCNGDYEEHTAIKGEIND